MSACLLSFLICCLKRAPTPIQYRGRHLHSILQSVLPWLTLCHTSGWQRSLTLNENFHGLHLCLWNEYTVGWIWGITASRVSWVIGSLLSETCIQTNNTVQAIERNHQVRPSYLNSFMIHSLILSNSPITPTKTERAAGT